MAHNRSASDPASQPGSERRQHPRTTADWPLQLQLADGPAEARLRDVSRSGLAFYIDREIPEMTVLGLDFEFPGPSGPARVQASGVVVRCERVSERLDHWEVAVFLHQIDAAAADAIETFVKSRAAG